MEQLMEAAAVAQLEVVLSFPVAAAVPLEVVVYTLQFPEVRPGD